MSLVHAEAGADTSGVEVRVELRLLAPGSVAEASLEARFEVRGQPVCVNSALEKGVSQWGLWDWDVVELFVGARGRAALPAYCEFQVSPLNQHFELEIFEPRVRFDREFVSGFRHEAAVTAEKSWHASMRIPLAKLGWSGEASDLVGGAFAILGAPGARSYWALSLPPQAKPDFHLPAHFTSFFGE